MKKKNLVLVLVAVVSVIVLTGCGVQANPENALHAPETFWQRILVFPLIQFITWLYNIVGDLGVAIIIATILTKLAVMPLMLKSMNSTAKMQAIKPEMDKINQKYAGKSDRESQIKKSTEMQVLYKESGINPLAGCLPMLIQMPLMLAFFQAFSRHPYIATNEVRYFLGMNFLSLSSVEEVPNIIFAAIVVGLMYYQQTVTQKRTQGDAGAQMKMMSLMFLPMMALLVYFSPLAMGLYFVISQVMMLIQSFIIKKPGAIPF